MREVEFERADINASICLRSRRLRDDISSFGSGVNTAVREEEVIYQLGLLKKELDKLLP